MAFAFGIQQLVAGVLKNVPISGTNPLPVQQSGGQLLDHSPVAVAVPPAGAPQLLATVLANPARNLITVQNQQNVVLVLVRDDGITVTGGTGPTGLSGTVSQLMLGGATGGSFPIYTSENFKGRLRVYGPTGATGLSVFED